MPVNRSIGGVEHAILHLMYARFFTKALHDMDLLEAREPFANLFTQGMITRDGAKMSKSRGNTVSPAEYVERFGADSLRTYICFMGPPVKGGDWSDEGVEGSFRLLERETYMLVVQVNGKLRDRIEVESDTPDDQLLELARASENVQRHLDGKAIVKEIVVPGRLVNLVVR